MYVARFLCAFLYFCMYRPMDLLRLEMKQHKLCQGYVPTIIPYFQKLLYFFRFFTTTMHAIIIASSLVQRCCVLVLFGNGFFIFSSFLLHFVIPVPLSSLLVYLYLLIVLIDTKITITILYYTHIYRILLIFDGLFIMLV